MKRLLLEKDTQWLYMGVADEIIDLTIKPRILPTKLYVVYKQAQLKPKNPGERRKLTL